MVTLTCGNQLFIKLTGAGRDAIGDMTEAPSCEGSKKLSRIQAGMDDAGDWRHASAAPGRHCRSRGHKKNR